MNSKADVMSFAATTAAYCIAYLTWWLQPYLIRDILENFHLRSSSAGLGLSVELFSTAVTSVAISHIGRNHSYRRIALSAGGLTTAGALLSVIANRYGELILARALIGVGEGGLLMVSVGTIAHARQPDRAYATVLFIANLFGISLGFLLSLLGRTLMGRSFVFSLQLLTVAALLPLLLFLPRLRATPSPTGTRADVGRHSISRHVTLLVSAVAIIAAATNSAWSFYFALGERAGLNSIAISRSIDYTLVASSLGAVVAMILGTRLGRFIPLALALCAQTVALAIMVTCSNIVSFDVAACVYSCCGLLALPYFFGCGAALDPSGRTATLVGATYLLAAATSPYLGGLLIEQFSLRAIAWSVAGASLIAGLLAYFSQNPRRNISLRTPDWRAR
jgi:predicted MFS family arabinose efflux permease